MQFDGAATGLDGATAAGAAGGAHHPRMRIHRYASLVLLFFTGCDGAVDSSLNANTTAPLAGSIASAWQDQVLYLTLPDRFFNGDRTNDQSGLSHCFNPNAPMQFHGGDFAGLQQKMGYLTDLGITAIWMTPVYKQAPHPNSGVCGYHGYWPDFVDPDDGAIDPKLGSARDLDDLIATAHGANIRVVFDMMVNNSGIRAHVVNQHPNWFHDPKNCARLGNPQIFCATFDQSDFAQEVPEAAAYLSNLNANWARRFDIDGIRLDHAIGVFPSYFRDSYFPTVRAVRPLFVFSEVFSGNLGDLKSYLNAGFDSTLNFPLQFALEGSLAHGGSVDQIASVIAAEENTFGANRVLSLVNFIDNHDMPRFVNGPGIGVNEDEIRRRLRLALFALFTLPGIPQLYAGDELGMYGGADPDNRRDMPTWAWNETDRHGTHPGQAVPEPQITFALVQKLIALRHENPPLRSGSYHELWRQNGGGNPNVFAFGRGEGNDCMIVAMNNGQNPAGPIPINAKSVGLPDGAILDQLLGDATVGTLVVANGKVSLTLPGKGAAVYRRRLP